VGVGVVVGTVVSLLLGAAVMRALEPLSATVAAAAMAATLIATTAIRRIFQFVMSGP
jgi:hypothetical protein